MVMVAGGHLIQHRVGGQFDKAVGWYAAGLPRQRVPETLYELCLSLHVVHHVEVAHLVRVCRAATHVRCLIGLHNVAIPMLQTTEVE